MMAAVVLITAAIFMIFILRPKQAQMQDLNRQMDEVRESLNNIKRIIGDSRDLGEGILRLRSEESALAAKFIRPENVGDLLGVLSEGARQFGVEVVSMQPSELKVCYGPKGETLRLDNSECNKASIDMDVLGSYRSLVDYIGSLEVQEAPFVLVRRFDIEKQQSSSSLRAHIVVDGFTLLPIN